MHTLIPKVGNRMLNWSRIQHLPLTQEAHINRAHLVFGVKNWCQSAAPSIIPYGLTKYKYILKELLKETRPKGTKLPPLYKTASRDTLTQNKDKRDITPVAGIAGVTKGWLAQFVASVYGLHGAGVPDNIQVRDSLAAAIVEILRLGAIAPGSIELRPHQVALGTAPAKACASIASMVSSMNLSTIVALWEMRVNMQKAPVGQNNSSIPEGPCAPLRSEPECSGLPDEVVVSGYPTQEMCLSARALANHSVPRPRGHGSLFSFFIAH